MQLPVKTINKHRAADKSVRLIILVRMIPCKLQTDKRYWLPPRQRRQKCLLTFVYGLINVALHREYSRGIVFIFSQGRKDLYHV
jgi:hypothetical protein